MGLNPPNHEPEHDPTDPTDPRDPRAAALDDLAVYALDAVDDEEARAIETRLATDPVAAELEVALREAAGELGAAAVVEVEPPPALRNRILAAAHARRRPVPTEPASYTDVHRIELERFEMLLRRLTPKQWESSVDPPEFAGWTIHDLAAHVTANEALVVQLLTAELAELAERPDLTGALEHLDLARHGVVVPETDNTNEPRSLQAIARHRTMSTDATIAELHACATAVDRAVTALTPDDLERDLSWWGNEMRILTVLTHRSFETWTHADDIRRALGLAEVPPPASSLKTMSSLASGWTALMVLASGHDHTGRSVRLELTGEGGGSYHVDLGLGGRDLTGVTPDAEITIDVVDYCRAIGDRYLQGPLAFEAAGDLALAQDVIGSLHALATT